MDLCSELSLIYKDGFFDNSTIEYYLNGFINTIGMEEIDGEWRCSRKKVVDSKYGPGYVEDTSLKQSGDTYLKISRKIYRFYEQAKLEGNINNMHFCFKFNYDKDILNKQEIRNLMFDIDVEIQENNNHYYLNICNENYYITCYMTEENKENVESKQVYFGINRIDLEIALSILRFFISNPNEVIMRYHRIKEKQKFFFLSDSLVCSSDEHILDKNGLKYTKVIK